MKARTNSLPGSTRVNLFGGTKFRSTSLTTSVRSRSSAVSPTSTSTELGSDFAFVVFFLSSLCSSPSCLLCDVVFGGLDTMATTRIATNNNPSTPPQPSSPNAHLGKALLRFLADYLPASPPVRTLTQLKKIV